MKHGLLEVTTETLDATGGGLERQGPFDDVTVTYNLDVIRKNMMDDVSNLYSWFITRHSFLCLGYLTDLHERIDARVPQRQAWHDTVTRRGYNVYHGIYYDRGATIVKQEVGDTTNNAPNTRATHHSKLEVGRTTSIEADGHHSVESLKPGWYMAFRDTVSVVSMVGRRVASSYDNSLRTNEDAGYNIDWPRTVDAVQNEVALKSMGAAVNVAGIITKDLLHLDPQWPIVFYHAACILHCDFSAIVVFGPNGRTVVQYLLPPGGPHGGTEMHDDILMALRYKLFTVHDKAYQFLYPEKMSEAMGDWLLGDQNE